jgi:methionyl-tRNA synthetase
MSSTEDPASAPAPREPAPAPPERQAGPRITIDRFFETELRVACVVSAERIPNADKLLKLDVDLGGERRQLVAGIAASYAPESLVGKRIVVVANLQPARIRGVESQGMLLAADVGGRPVLATFEEPVPPGTLVR